MSLDAIINCICSAEGSSKTASQNFRTPRWAWHTGKSTPTGFELFGSQKNRTDAVVVCCFCSKECKKQTEQLHFRPKQHRHHFLSLDDQSHSCRQILWMVVVDLLSSWILYPKSQSLYRITRIQTIASRFEKQSWSCLNCGETKEKRALHTCSRSSLSLAQNCATSVSCRSWKGLDLAKLVKWHCFILLPCFGHANESTLIPHQAPRHQRSSVSSLEGRRSEFPHCWQDSKRLQFQKQASSWHHMQHISKRVAKRIQKVISVISLAYVHIWEWSWRFVEESPYPKLTQTQIGLEIGGDLDGLSLLLHSDSNRPCWSSLCSLSGHLWTSHLPSAGCRRCSTYQPPQCLRGHGTQYVTVNGRYHGLWSQVSLKRMYADADYARERVLQRRWAMHSWSSTSIASSESCRPVDLGQHPTIQHGKHQQNRHFKSAKPNSAMPSHAQPCPALSSPSRDPSPAHSSGSLQRRPGTVSTVGTVGTVELQRPGRPAARPPGLELRKCVRKFAVPGKTSDMGRRCKICKTGKIQRNGEISPLISPVKEINCQWLQISSMISIEKFYHL